MYVLYADTHETLKKRSQLFEQYMEPLLVRLDALYQTNGVSWDLSEIAQYLRVCRWPFRKLEYSFAPDALFEHLKPGDTYLDAGCGVTAFACDSDKRLIDGLGSLQLDKTYGAQATYATQDLAEISYPDDMFDAISCISVLEHIPAPADQDVIHEPVSQSKARGILVFTIDYMPASGEGPWAHWWYYLRRLVHLA